MGKNCFICKKVIPIYSIRQYTLHELKERGKQTPEGMTKDDIICNTCFKSLKTKNNSGETSRTTFTSGPKINKLSREQIETERKRRQRLSRERGEEQRRIEQNRIHSQTISEKPTPSKPKPKPGLFSRFGSKPNIPSANQILQSHDPYGIFGLKPDTTCQEVKSQFKELSRTYNASRGSINKSKEEKAQINAIQSRINTAYDTLRKRHCG